MRARAGAVLQCRRLLAEVPVLTWPGSVEPAADAQPRVPLFVDDDFLDGVETLAGLDPEKDKLVPARGDGLGGSDVGLGHGAALLYGVELECAAVLGTPWFVVWEGHVENIGHAAGADHVVVVEEMAAAGIRIDGHVLGRARERTTTRHGLKKRTEARRVEGITKGEKVREEGTLVVGEIGEGGEVACLIDLASG